MAVRGWGEGGSLGGPVTPIGAFLNTIGCTNRQTIEPRASWKEKDSGVQRRDRGTKDISKQVFGSESRRDHVEGWQKLPMIETNVP